MMYSSIGEKKTLIFTFDNKKLANNEMWNICDDGSFGFSRYLFTRADVFVYF